MNTNRVLVLEDDQTLREALTDTLELSGYQVDEAEDIDSAIVKWSSSQPDIVVSDVNLGVANC